MNVESPQASTPGLTGNRRRFRTEFGEVNCFYSIPEAPAVDRPILLVHTVNAAAGAHEIRPLYDHFRTLRPTYAIDLPGFGLTERRKMRYSLRIMTDALVTVAKEIHETHSESAIDALAASLSCEFLARAATENSGLFRSLALVSPTGFDRRAPYNAAPGTDRGIAAAWRFFSLPLVGSVLFRLLTTRPSIRFFLRKSWGSPHIDNPMAEQAWHEARRPNAQYAPFSFLSGFLFAADISTIYQQLDLPVWVSHGVRGDFQDYSWKQQIADRQNWQTQVYSTGALPYFEIPDEFFRDYEAFLIG